MPGYGENSWIGFGEETVWGTPVPRTKFIEILSENVHFISPSVPRAVLRGASRRYVIPGKRSVEGSVRAELLYDGLEKLFKHALGSDSVEDLGGGTYRHTFTVADQPPTGLTLEINRDICAFVYEGCQVQSLTLENAVDGTVQLAFDFLGENETTGAASVPTFPADNPVHWAQIVPALVTRGAVAVPVSNIRVSVADTLAADRYRLGTKTRKGIGRNGRMIVSGSFSCEFEDVTQYNAFLGDTESAVTISWTGPIIGGTLTNYNLSITMLRTVLSGDTPMVAGPGPIQITFNFDAYAKIVAPLSGPIVVELLNAVPAA
jgi:Phage tail tube protein